MSRKPRIHVPGGLYHITMRGNNRGIIFHSQDDRRRWTRILSDALKRYNHQIHAFCWMSNHIHLALKISHQPVSAFMQYTTSRYARETNKILGRTGHFFERRYHATLVNSDQYLLALIRYIHLNPVNAGLTNDPDTYPWSSHSAYLGLTYCDFLITDWALSLFDSRRHIAIKQYRRFMQAGLETEHTEMQYAQSNTDARFWGNDDFIAQLDPEAGKTESIKSLDEIAKDICATCGIDEQTLKKPAKNRRHTLIRAQIAKQAISQGTATLSEVAKRYNRSPSALSQAMRKLSDP
ncbi:MAG: transposase [Gammaproteobacteria bacterium]|nr:transposase [Gammaproteobacteria bacterium]